MTQVAIFHNNMDNSILGIEVKVCQYRRNRRSFYDRSILPQNAGGVSFTYFTEGSVHVVLNDSTFTVSAGELVVIEPGERFSFEAKLNSLVSFYNIGLAPVTNNGYVLKRDLLGISPLCRPESREQMEEFCNKLNLAFHDKNQKYRIQECSIIALKLFLLLKPLQDTFKVSNEGRDNRKGKDKIKDILDYISLHYKDKLTVGALAKKTGLHPSRFSRLFKEVTGVYPQRYIMERKVMKSKDFLLVHRESLTSTAAELGFHDYSHFYKTFKRISGISPDDFIKRA
ncbi:MAG: helix-turn-helix domain-containing protein [Fibrobacteres bacterium]|nr:helix-turn-helix domain-containing protein [Fibrobacterota bacterium]